MIKYLCISRCKDWRAYWKDLPPTASDQGDNALMHYQFRKVALLIRPIYGNDMHHYEGPRCMRLFKKIIQKSKNQLIEAVKKNLLQKRRENQPIKEVNFAHLSYWRMNQVTTMQRPWLFSFRGKNRLKQFLFCGALGESFAPTTINDDYIGILGRCSSL